MGESNLQTILANLKSTDKEKVYFSLMKIRSSIITDAQGIQNFHNAGGLELLVELLKYPNKKNLDITLSILGNCCLTENCSLTVGRLKVSELLVNIIKNIASDSILCRTCRLIANLSVHKENAEFFCSAGVVWSLTNIIVNFLDIIEQSKENCISLATAAMAIRAIGILWAVENCRDDIISVGAVKIIVRILAHQKIQNDSNILEYTNVTLKTLVAVTTLNNRENTSKVCDYLASQICYDDKIIEVFTNIINKNYENTSHGRKYKQVKINSNLALTILCNLCKMDQCRDMLGKSTALPTLMLKINSEEGFKGLILLCRDKRVHAKARSSGALKILMKSIKLSESKRKISLVLDVLGQYILDKNTIFELVDDGLISVLIGVINNYIESINCSTNPVKNCKHTCSNHPKCNLNSKQEETEDKLKLKRNQETKCDLVFKKLLIDGSKAQFSYYLSSNPSSPSCNSRALWSPQSDSTGYSSLGATPPRRDSIENDDFESYSPICSDNEGEGDYPVDDGIHIEDQNSENMNKFADLDELYDEDECNLSFDEDHQDLNDFDIKDDCTRDVLICVKLLQQVTFYDCIIPQLAQAETIKSLLKFIVIASQGIRYAIYTLKEILSRVEYLKTLLKTDVVVEMYNIMNSEISDCKQCTKAKERIVNLRLLLQSTAESACGIGEIENVLCLGSAELRTKFILEMSLLIDSVAVLRKILYKFGALKDLINLIKDLNYRKNALLAIINYAKILERTDPTKRSYFQNSPSVDLKIPMIAEDKIKFIVNGSYELCIDRKILIEKSNVFETMLNGTFLESKGVIYINDVEEESLKYFFKLLYVDLENLINVHPPLPVSINSAMEALMLTDKYLLLDLNSFLCKVIVQYLLKPNNAYEIYKQSLYLRTENIKQECIAFILNNSVASYELFNILNSNYKDDVILKFMSDVIELLQEKQQ